MKTEGWEKSFREKVNGLDTPPPQTQWNRARSWAQVKAQIPTVDEQPIIPLRAEAIRPRWRYYVAASISLLLLFGFVFTVHIRQQDQKISQLNVALLQAQNRNTETALAKKTIPTTHVPSQENSYPLPNDRQTAPLLPNPTKHRLSTISEETSSEKAFTQATDSIQVVTHSTNQADKQLALPHVDTKPKNADLGKEAALKAFLTQSAGNANRTESSVILTFPGKEPVLEENTLAQETAKPPKKRLFQMLANGRNTDNTPQKPAEWIGFPTILTAKTTK